MRVSELSSAAHAGSSSAAVKIICMNGRAGLACRTLELAFAWKDFSGDSRLIIVRVVSPAEFPGWNSALHFCSSGAKFANAVSWLQTRRSTARFNAEA
ncbi:hypothetical protein G7A66_01870 [Altererythrobacter sp. SALINAS58]|nr:hypothetical protein [Alteripontixanthobacter muriae]